MKHCKTLYLYAVGLLGAFTVSCKQQARNEHDLAYRMYTEEELQRVIVVGEQEAKLTRRFGQPFATYQDKHDKNVRRLEFQLDTDSIRGPYRPRLGSFLVTISNNVVVSWRPWTYVAVEIVQPDGRATFESSATNSRGSEGVTSRHWTNGLHDTTQDGR